MQCVLSLIGKCYTINSVHAYINMHGSEFILKKIIVSVITWNINHSKLKMRLQNLSLRKGSKKIHVSFITRNISR